MSKIISLLIVGLLLFSGCTSSKLTVDNSENEGVIENKIGHSKYKKSKAYSGGELNIYNFHGNLYLVAYGTKHIKECSVKIILKNGKKWDLSSEEVSTRENNEEILIANILGAATKFNIEPLNGETYHPEDVYAFIETIKEVTVFYE